MPNNLVAARIERRIVFACGCICEFPLLGIYTELGEWHCIPCKEHSPGQNLEKLQALELKAEEVWRAWRRL